MSRREPFGKLSTICCFLLIFILIAALPLAAQRPTADSMSPNGGTGDATFSFKVSDPGGYSNLNFVQVIFNPTAAYANGCAFMYLVGANRVYLMNDAGTTWVGSMTLGTSNTLSNSKCTISGAAATASGSGNELTVNLPISFSGPYVGQVNVFAYAKNGTGNSGWQKLGTWTPIAFVPVPERPTVDSVTPNPAVGSPITLTFKYSSANGYAYIDWVQGIINTRPLYPSSCSFNYFRPSNRLYVSSDAGTTWLGPVRPGQTGTVSNSQCTLDAGRSSVSGTGNTLTLTLAVTAAPGVPGGTYNIYGIAGDHGGLRSEWMAIGTLQLPNITQTPPAVVSATSVSGTTSLVFASENGGSYISWVQEIIGSSFSYANGCSVYYKQSGLLYLMNDAGTTWQGPVTLGQSGTLSNSQCTINAASSSATVVGNNLTVNLATTYAAGFSGQRNAWGYAVDNAGRNSTWVNLGSFNAQ